MTYFLRVGYLLKFSECPQIVPPARDLCSSWEKCPANPTWVKLHTTPVLTPSRSSNTGRSKEPHRREEPSEDKYSVSWEDPDRTLEQDRSIGQNWGNLNKQWI
jgi:hypothetical protein